MFNAFMKVIKSKDALPGIEKGLEGLADLDILVGIPQEGSSREGLKDITNAELAYIHTHGIRKRSMILEMDEEMDRGTPYSKAYELYIRAHGSPLWRAPPRPIIEPAIEDPENKKIIAENLKKAAQAALDEDRNQALIELKKAGITAQNVVRDWFTNPKNNWAPNSPFTVERKGSDRPLVDTGELRKSITYVIRRKGG